MSRLESGSPPPNATVNTPAVASARSLAASSSKPGSAPAGWMVSSRGSADAATWAEAAAGLNDLATYRQFGATVEAHKREILRHLIDLVESGKRVAAYGAPAKGNTMLNYCGIRTNLISFDGR